MSAGTVLAWALAVYGWALVLTKGEGPWDVLKRARAAWPRGPLRCPMCVGPWIGLLGALLFELATRYPVAEAPVSALGCMGGAAGAAWIGVHAGDVLRWTAEVQRRRAKGEGIPLDPLPRTDTDPRS